MAGEVLSHRYMNIRRCIVSATAVEAKRDPEANGGTLDPRVWRPGLRYSVSLDAPSRYPRHSEPRIESSNHGRWAVLAIIAFSISVSLIVALLAMPSPPAGPGLPRRAPDFSLTTDEGSFVSLSQFMGRPVVIHFVILVCCSYSALEVGYMKEVEPVATDVGAVLISIAMNSSYNYFSPQEYRNLMGFNWTLALDLDGVVQRLYSALETSTYVIDAKGMIRYQDDETTAPSLLAQWLRGVSNN